MLPEERLDPAAGPAAFVARAVIDFAAPDLFALFAVAVADSAAVVAGPEVGFGSHGRFLLLPLTTLLFMLVSE
jgi:hypothetical protein